MKALILFALLSAWTDFGGVASIDHTTHDWGDVSLDAGPLTCSFEVKNTSKSDILITSVVSSCGCTDVKWTKDQIAPGKTGSISATYSNEEGPFPFDKTLTVYIDRAKKPMVLHLRGVVHKGEVTLADAYPVRMGKVGVKSLEIKAGNMSQGETKSAEIRFANFGAETLTLTLAPKSAQLSFSENEISIKPGSDATVAYTIESSRTLWGKNYYPFDILEGKDVLGSMSLWAVTKEDFSSLTKEQKKQGPRIDLEDNTFTFNPVKAGTPIEAVFRFSASDGFQIYKVDIDSPCARMTELSKKELHVSVDTRDMEKGEQLILVTLYTNAPLRPIVNLFIVGNIR